MPIWTAQDDLTLLAKILEAHPSLTIDADAVSNVWPDELVKRTPRAIKERIGKIKKITGKIPASKNASIFKSISKGVKSVKNKDQDQTVTNVDTPEKLNFLRSRFPTSHATSSRRNGSNDKRKRMAAFSDDEEEEPLSSSGSDTDDSEMINDTNNSPTKAASSDKMRLRAVSSRKYAVDSADGSSDDDAASSEDGDSEDADGEFDPLLECEKQNHQLEKRAARSNRSRSGSTTM